MTILVIQNITTYSLTIHYISIGIRYEEYYKTEQPMDINISYLWYT